MKWFADKGKRGGNDKKRNAGVEASKRRKSRIRKKKYMKNGGSIPSLGRILVTEFFILLKTNPMFGNASQQMPSRLFLTSQLYIVTYEFYFNTQET